MKVPQTSSRKERREGARIVSKLKKRIRLRIKKPALEGVVQQKAVSPRRVLDWTNHDPAKQLPLETIITRIIALAQVIAEKQFYAYQVEVAYRIVESVLLHDGEVITALISRQSGKTEVIGALVAALAIILPQLAKEFPDSWMLNITDESGVERGYARGFNVGIYAPRLEQSEIMFNRVKHCLGTDSGKKVLSELKITFNECNGDRVTLSNGSRVLCQTASEQSKIEGETHHLLIAEEAQDIGDMKMRKSLHPMVSSLLGSIVKIGTASTKKCDFYTTIKNNERVEALTTKRSHFFYPYLITARYNSMYRRYVENERMRLGEDSDEFRMSYGCEWIFERGMFLTQPQLFHRDIAMTDGLFSLRHPRGLHRQLAQYSLVAGIDWGQSSDSTVVTLVAVDWNTPVETGTYFDNGGEQSYIFYQKHVLDWLEFIGDNYEYQFWNILSYLQSFPRMAKVVTDSNTCGKPIYDRLVATLAGTGVEVVGNNFQSKNKSDGYKSLYSDFCGHRITFPANKTVRQTVQYRKFVSQMLDARKDYKNGLMVVAHPPEKDAHDDYCDSLMLAAEGANTPATTGGVEIADANFFFSR